MQFKWQKISVWVLGLILGGSSLSSAIEIQTPSQGTIVHPGDKVKIRVVPSPGETLGGVLIGGIGEDVITTPPYEYDYQVDPKTVGKITIRIVGVTPDEQISSTVDLNLIVALPSTVTLQSITVDPSQGILFLEPDVLKTKEIGVGGVYSDGVKRSIKGSSFGTTYQSSDENVVTVDAEGVLHAIAAGKATITIKNGGKTAKTQVEVRAKTRF